MDKYYIEEIRLPLFENVEDILNNVRENINRKEIAINRNDIFYRKLVLDTDMIECIESNWTFPIVRNKKNSVYISMKI